MINLEGIMRRIGGLFGIAALLAATITGPQAQATADADQVISEGRVTPSSIKLYATGSTSITVEARVTGKAPLLVTLAFGAPNTFNEECISGYSQGTMTLVSGDPSNGVWRGQVPIDDTYVPGNYVVGVQVLNYDGSVVKPTSVANVGTVQVRRDAYLTKFNAGPEPARKKKPITVTGMLKRLACKNASAGPPGKYLPYGGRTVTIQFRASGTKIFRTMATARTASSGLFTKNFTAKQSGTWRAIYAGSTYYVSSTSAEDYVSVR